MGKKSLGSEKEGRKGLETERSIKVSRGGVGKQTEGNKAAQENCGVAFIFPPSTVICNTPSLTGGSYGILTCPKPTKWS